MPSWFWILFIATFVVHVLIAFIMSPPEAVANWLVGKFQLHPELRGEDAVVSVNGVTLDGEDKKQFIVDFNKAAFLQRYYDGIPRYSEDPAVVVTTKQGKRDVSFHLYAHKDYIDVIKHWNTKVVAYRILSRNLQNRLLSPNTQGVTV